MSNTQKKTLHIVGENPGGKIDDFDPSRYRPLFPYPGGSGSRLQKMSGLSVQDYIDLTHRHNLFDTPRTKWNSEHAKFAAKKLLPVIRNGLPVILLGKKVAAAFGIRRAVFFKDYCVEGNVNVIVIPHPSGLNRLFNGEEIRERVKETFSSVTSVNSYTREGYDG